MSLFGTPLQQIERHLGVTLHAAVAKLVHDRQIVERTHIAAIHRVLVCEQAAIAASASILSKGTPGTSGGRAKSKSEAAKRSHSLMLRLSGCGSTGSSDVIPRYAISRRASSAVAQPSNRRRWRS